MAVFNNDIYLQEMAAYTLSVRVTLGARWEDTPRAAALWNLSRRSQVDSGYRLNRGFERGASIVECGWKAA